MRANPSLPGLPGTSAIVALSEVKVAGTGQYAQSVKEKGNDPSLTSETKPEIRNKGGRPSSLQRLGIAREDIWNLAVQGLSNAQIAKRLSRCKGKISVRTIATYRAEMPANFKARAEEFNRLPNLDEYFTWLKTRFARERDARDQISSLRTVWEACWKKPFEVIDENDVIRAIAWIREKHKGNELGFVMAIRYLIRWGIGHPSWLSKHLDTKGKKAAPRSLAILSSPEFFEKTLPRIIAEVDNLKEFDYYSPQEKITLTPRARDELRLVLWIKPTTGIRTGMMNYGSEVLERELWGTRIGAGKTNLQIVDGKIADWTVFAKRKEVWHIRFMPAKVRDLLISHVRKYRIQQGEPLLHELTARVASRALAAICRSLGICELRMHDLRKVYLTGLCLSGVPLETAVELNVGWLDLNTARKHYLQVKALNAGDEYSKMVERFFK